MFTWEIVMAYFMKNLMKNLKPRHGFKLWVSVGLFIRLLKVILKIINVHTFIVGNREIYIYIHVSPI